MDSLLFLCHRLPFPPNKGDKVRSYHWLRHLAGRYRVFLGTFIDDQADWQHVEALKALCADVHVEALHPAVKRVASGRAFLTGEALTLPYFRSRKLSDWVGATVARERIMRAFAYSSPMAQYLLNFPRMRRIVDFVDADAAKWAAYARQRSWPASAFYAREARRLLAFERDVAAHVDAVAFVTDEEARWFRDMAGGSLGRLETIRNGVDGDYFSPSTQFESPFAADEHAIVFTGAMDYWPNVDAVLWFAREVLPIIREKEPSARFYVVGMNPSAAVRGLARVVGAVGAATTVVTGRVADVRPYLQHARVVVAPLRVARGIQNKVLEAMAMAKPVVATPDIAASLSAQRGIEIEVAFEPDEFAARVVELMDAGRAARMGERARRRVLADYAWPASQQLLDDLIDGEVVPAPPRRPVPTAETCIPLTAR